jgi:hypothetical protein
VQLVVEELGKGTFRHEANFIGILRVLRVLRG